MFVACTWMMEDKRNRSEVLILGVDAVISLGITTNPEVEKSGDLKTEVLCWLTGNVLQKLKVCTLFSLSFLVYEGMLTETESLTLCVTNSFAASCLDEAEMFHYYSIYSLIV